MINNIHQVTEKINDEFHHLESFIKCPYKLYFQHFLAFKEGQIRWRQVVQVHINWVVQAYHKLPVEKQTKLAILKLIEENWSKVNPSLFHSKEDYYLVLAKTTDHLLKFISPSRNDQSQFAQYKKLNTNKQDLETQLSLTFEEVDDSSPDDFKIKKFLLEVNQELIELYSSLIAVFSYEAFGILPKKIEIITLLEGKTFTHIPKEEDIPKGVMYIDYLKSNLIQPKEYQKIGSLKECLNCPFTDQCMDSSFSVNSSATTKTKYLH